MEIRSYDRLEPQFSGSEAACFWQLLKKVRSTGGPARRFLIEFSEPSFLRIDLTVYGVHAGIQVSELCEDFGLFDALIGISPDYDYHYTCNS